MTDPSVHLAGSTVDTHNHICAFFRQRDEEYGVLLPFITEGIGHGEHAFHIVDPALRADHMKRLKKAGVAVAAAEERQQLEVHDWHETHLRGGNFDYQAMISLVEQMLEGARLAGFARTRSVAHMEWALLGGFSGSEDLVQYETRLNYILSRYQDPVICVYDTARFSAEVVLDILRTHPMVILEGVLQVNPFFIPPDEFLRELHQRRRRGGVS